MYANRFSIVVLTFLLVLPIGVSALSPVEQAVVDSKNILGVSASGGDSFPILTLQDPLGRRIGQDPKTGELLPEVAGTEFDLGRTAGSVAIVEPISGTYTVTFTGKPEAKGDRLMLEITPFPLPAGQVEGHQLWVMYNGSSYTFSFDYNARSQAISNYSVPLSIVDTESANVGGKAKIYWMHLPDPRIKSYAIYREPHNDKGFRSEKIATVPAGTYSYQTSDTWYEDSKKAPLSDRYFYTVIGVMENGQEGFWFNSAGNYLYVFPRADYEVVTREPLVLRFIDISAGEITARAWDINDDGTIESRDRVFEMPITGKLYGVSLTIDGPFGQSTEFQSIWNLEKESLARRQIREFHDYQKAGAVGWVPSIKLYGELEKILTGSSALVGAKETKTTPATTKIVPDIEKKSEITLAGNQATQTEDVASSTAPKAKKSWPKRFFGWIGGFLGGIFH